MYDIKQINLNKIKEFFTKLPRNLAENFFASFLCLLFLALLFNGFLFYKYYILVEKTELKLQEKGLEIEQKTLQKVLQAWQAREKRFKSIDSKTYINPFQEQRQEIIEPLNVQTEPPQQPELISEPKIEEPEPEQEPEPETEPEPEQESEPESTPELPKEKSAELQTTSNLLEFYTILEQDLPLIKDRAQIWQSKGLGAAEEYEATEAQNAKLLQALKEQFSQ